MHRGQRAGRHPADRRRDPGAAGPSRHRPAAIAAPSPTAPDDHRRGNRHADASTTGIEIRPIRRATRTDVDTPTSDWMQDFEARGLSRGAGLDDPEPTTPDDGESTPKPAEEAASHTVDDEPPVDEADEAMPRRPRSTVRRATRGVAGSTDLVHRGIRRPVVRTRMARLTRQHTMGIEYASIVDHPIDEVWAWHTRPGAMRRLVPPWQPMRWSRRPNRWPTATAILGLPGGLRWIARHDPAGYDPPHQFVDVLSSRTGLMTLPPRIIGWWRHTHRYSEAGRGQHPGARRASTPPCPARRCARRSPTGTGNSPMTSPPTATPPRPAAGTAGRRS